MWMRVWQSIESVVNETVESIVTAGAGADADALLQYQNVPGIKL